MRQIYHKVWSYGKMIVKFNSDTPGLLEILGYFRKHKIKIYSKPKGKMMMFAVDLDYKSYEKFCSWANTQMQGHIQMPKQMLQIS